MSGDENDPYGSPVSEKLKRLLPRPTPLRLTTTSLALLLILLFVAIATAWTPTWASPMHDRPHDVSDLAETAQRLGYDVHATLLGADAVQISDPERTLYVVPALHGSDGGPSPHNINDLAKDGAKVLALDEGQAAPLLAEYGWTLQNTPIYGSDLDATDAGLVDLRWRVGGTTHAVEGARPLPLVALDDDTSTQGTGIQSSNRSFADLDGDRTLTEEAIRGPFTVGVDLGMDRGGRLVYATTPHPITNAATERGNAEGFPEALLSDLLPEGGDVLFDTSHADRPTGLDTGHRVARGLTWPSTCLVCTVAAIATVSVFGFLGVQRHDRDHNSWAKHEPSLRECRNPDE